MIIRKSILIPRVTTPNVLNPYGYVYVTTNLVNGKKYVGQHCCHSVRKGYLGSGTAIKEAIKKYGKENFIAEPIDWAESKEALDQKESWWVDFFGAVKSKNWYNLVDGGGSLPIMTGENHPMYGKGYKIAGKKNGMYGKRGELAPMYGKGYKIAGERSPMYGKCGELSPMYGKHLSEETRQKMSEVRKGEKNPFYGRHHTEETKQKISEANTGRKLTEETKQKISEAHTGRKRTEEAKKNISEAKIGDKNPMYGKSGFSCPTAIAIVIEETNQVIGTLKDTLVFLGVSEDLVRSRLKTHQELGERCGEYASCHIYKLSNKDVIKKLNDGTITMLKQ